jgi:peptidoglycan/xylan/chitin deacetylase (PgdA/CDA1 family)
MLLHAKNLAITFDDLPLNGGLAPGMTRVGIVRNVLEILKSQRVPPVYGFVNAIGLEGNIDGANALKLWVSGGQMIGNHTYSHADLNTNTTESFLEDVRRNEPVLELLDGSDRWHWLRYPYLHEGDTLEKRRAVRSQLSQRGYRIAQVTLDYQDYLWNSAYARCHAKADNKSIEWLRTSYLTAASQHLDADRQMTKSVFGREISHVLLLHLGAFSSSILPDLLNLLRQKGFTLVTLDKAQQDPAYDSDPDAASPQGGTLLGQWMNARALQYPDMPGNPYQQLETICQ